MSSSMLMGYSDTIGKQIVVFRASNQKSPRWASNWVEVTGETSRIKIAASKKFAI
jgi:hypothetical protein